MITPAKKEELALFHQEFLHTPVAYKLRALFEKHEATLVKALADQCMLVDAVNDQTYRQLGVQLRTTQSIKTLIFDSETFVEKSTQ